MNTKITNEPHGRLKSLREQLGFTQNEFAAFLGVQQGSYSAIEGGTVGISPKRQRLLEEVFNVNIHWLMTGEGSAFLSHTPKKIDRIKDVLNHYKLSLTEFIESLNLKPAEKVRFEYQFKAGLNPETGVIDAIIKFYPEVNPTYLLTGKGYLLLGNKKANITFKDGDPENSVLMDNIELLKELSALQKARIAFLEETMAEEKIVRLTPQFLYAELKDRMTGKQHSIFADCGPDDGIRYPKKTCGDCMFKRDCDILYGDI